MDTVKQLYKIFFTFPDNYQTADQVPMGLVFVGVLGSFVLIFGLGAIFGDNDGKGGVITDGENNIIIGSEAGSMINSEEI